MGQAELNTTTRELIIHSIIYLYGEASSFALATQVADDIRNHWNEPQAVITIKKSRYDVRFSVEGIYEPSLAPETVWYNDDPRLNFFRVEEYVMGNISFVDGIGSNTGYFKLQNLMQTSSTAAHEYGHTIGLVHPELVDLRGGVLPGIMYPRGTICDPHLQYDPTAAPAAYGGFLDPKHRRVTIEDIEDLHLDKVDFNRQGQARLGEFSSVYHQKHMEGFG